MRWIFTALLITFSSLAHASDDYACVQYQRVDFSWGDWYRIPVVIANGRELNQAMETTRFNSWNNYAVGTWPNGGYSLFTIPSYMTTLTFNNTRTTDQSGRTYHIRKPDTFGSCPSF